MYSTDNIIYHMDSSQNISLSSYVLGQATSLDIQLGLGPPNDGVIGRGFGHSGPGLVVFAFLLPIGQRVAALADLAVGGVVVVVARDSLAGAFALGLAHVGARHDHFVACEFNSIQLLLYH